MSNPDEFIRLIRLAGQAGTDGNKINTGSIPNEAQRRILFRYLARAEVYNGTEDEFNEDYEAALQQNLQDATDEQMQELGLQ